MGLFDHFPYTNVHELNLDWVLSMMKALEAEWKAFTAGNSLTFADPLQHDISKTYAKNTIVLDDNGNAYVSLQPVPVGVALSNQDYWLMVFDYEAFLEKVNKNFTARYYRDQYRATAAMAIGDWLTVDDVLCKATAAIAVDDVLEIGVNIDHFTLEDFIKAFMTSANQMIQQYKNDIDASELAYRQQLAQDIANTTASLQAQLDAAISGATVDSEVINARVAADGTTYPTLGDAIRTQITQEENSIIATNTGYLAWRPYPIVTNINTISTSNPNRAHSDLYRTTEEVDITCYGLPAGYRLDLYATASLASTISGNSRQMTNGEPLTVSLAKPYYRFVLRTPNDESDASLTTGIYIDVKPTITSTILSDISDLQNVDTDLYNQIAELDIGFIVWKQYPLMTNIITLNTNRPNEAHSNLYRAGQNISITPHGIDDTYYKMYLYVRLNTSATIAGAGKLMTNGEAMNVPAGSYYRFVLITEDGDYPAYNVTDISIDISINGQYDLILFAGQSNMAGRGITSAEHPETSPTVIDGAGYEFRPISDPTKLYPIEDPFGLNENQVGGLNDGNDKTGSMVPAFVNSYYLSSGVPIIAVSASQGGTNLLDWVTGYDENTGKLYDAVTRLQDAIDYCDNHYINVRRILIAWCQGESDASSIHNNEYTMEDYVSYWETVQNAFKSVGADKMLVIRIGYRAGNDGEDTGSTRYNPVIEKQTELCQTDPDLIMVSTDFVTMRARGLMKDQSHYYQAAYNEVGDYAGVNSAIYADQYKEPTMYDAYYTDLYYTHKN